MSSEQSRAWTAPPGCPDHVRYIVEKTVNAYPTKWLKEPSSGEVFSSIKECHNRLIAFSLSQGFDVVVSRSSQTPQPRATFSCIHHGTETRNTRRLPAIVERDKEGNVIGERQRDLTVVRQTDCPWECRVSYKSVGKRGEAQKGFILTVKSISHGESHPLAQNPLIYQRHRERLEEYQVLKAHAQAHRVSVLPYSLSRRVLDAVDGTGLSLTRKEYYNLKKHQTLNFRDEKTIEGLLYALDAVEFVYRCRIEDEVDEVGKIKSRKLVQIWFTHPKLLEAGARFVAGSVCIIDATFNTNKARLPIIVAVGVLSNGKTFPLAFSYCRSEDHESYSFFWASLKEHWPTETAPPAVVISDQAGAILSSLKEEFPEAIHQICEWHAVEAMCTKFRQYHTNLEIQGGKDKDGNVVESLKDFAYAYIKSTTAEDLETHRTALYERLKQGGKDYIDQIWRQKEERVVRYYTRLNFNLGCHSSQRSESYHVVLKQMTNGQLSLENSVIALTQTVLRLISDMESDKESDIRSYSRLAQAAAFKHLRLNITNFALTKIALEWDDLCRIAPTAIPESVCQCEILLQFGLPCTHYLTHYYLTGQPIPRSLCHPRWWLNGPTISTKSWAPYVEYAQYRAPPEPLFTPLERQLLELRGAMTSENQHRFDRQRARKQELLDQQMVELGSRRLQIQQLPVYNPDPVPKRSWVKQKSHGRADARGLTANELGQRRQRQEARQQAEEEALERLYQTASQNPFDSQLSTITVAPRRQQSPESSASETAPTTPPQTYTTIAIRTPTTAERPRLRRTPSPEASPLPASAYELPTSTAPPKLGREKRKRPHTKKYQESRAMGEIAESQEVHKAK